MTSITEIARKFFEACETGKGWEGCKAYCNPGATFSAQAEPLSDTRTLQQYTEWMKGLLTPIPDGRYEVKSFATDDERKSVCAYAVFSGTHTGPGGPCPPTGKRVKSDYVYVMEFDGEQDPAYDEDLACRMGHEGARVDLISGGFVSDASFRFSATDAPTSNTSRACLLLSRLDPEMF